MNIIEQILALESVEEQIGLLKKRKTALPNTQKNLDDWQVDRHEIMVDKTTYPDRKVLIKKGKSTVNPRTGEELYLDDQYKTEPINRIAIPLEQDIVNIQTAFTVGTEPKLNCNPSSEEEENLLSAINTVLSNSKIKYQNKKIVRSWLSEQEVAEYWYTVADGSFWERMWAKLKSAFKGTSKPTRKLRSTIWSPFRGDTLYPLFDDYSDLVALSREYKRKNLDGTEVTCFQTVTKDKVYQWEDDGGWKLIESKTFKHGFEKMPVVYAYRDSPYCHKIKTLRVRIEKLLSNYADCIDYHFFPILKLFGDVAGVMGQTKDRAVKLEGEGADAQYLVWQQAPDTIKLELETMFNNAYAMTNTPRISFESMKGFGQTPSGTAFRFVFMGAHMAVENHAEDIGDFLQRRINFLASALGSINPYEFSEAAKTIDVNVEVVPYMIDSLDERVETAIKAKEGEVWSQRTACLFAGNADRIDEEIEQIRKEKEENKNEKEVI